MQLGEGVHVALLHLRLGHHIHAHHVVTGKPERVRGGNEREQLVLLCQEGEDLHLGLSGEEVDTGKHMAETNIHIWELQDRGVKN